MKNQDLENLNLDELELELDKCSFSKKSLSSILKAEKKGKNRTGAIDLIQSAINLLDEESDVEDYKYFVADKKSICFRAGIKVAGEEVLASWPEFKDNPALLSEMIDIGLVVKEK